VVSWAIIVSKRKDFKEKQAQNDEFYDQFSKAQSLDSLKMKAENYPESSIAKVFLSGYTELNRMADRQSQGNEKPLLSGIDNIDRSVNKSMENAIAQSEHRLSFLATTGSTGPFIGLFGTVWGIMGSFQKIGETGVAHLAVVAPGISEALIATAVGLFAAIPASIAYNHFLTLIRKEEIQLNSFRSDFINIVKNNFFSKES
jgi:biopolymer transport protein TolQ